MGWLAIVTALLPLLLQLLEWLTKLNGWLQARLDSGEELTATQQKRLSRVYGRLEAVHEEASITRGLLKKAGCRPDG